EQSALARFALGWQGVDKPRSGDAALLDAIAQLEGALVPASDLESRILPSRVSGFDESDLDELLASGAVLWVGGGAIGPRDGRVALYLAEHASLVPVTTPRDGSTHQRIREVLTQRGAIFFPQLLAALGGGFAPEVKDALWDLVWNGEVTNDSLHALRAFMRPSPSRNVRRRGPAQRGQAPELAGRWSLVSSYADAKLTTTERLTSRVRQMLDHYGVITREVVQAEEVEGGFAAVYGVLRAMEEAARVRRGYFVAGRGAAQFALPGAVDRLRATRDADETPTVVTLAATDPANPYGAALGWPKQQTDEPEIETDAERTEKAGLRRPMRSAGALVILVDGLLAAWVAKDRPSSSGARTVPWGERALLTFTDGEEIDAARTRTLIAKALADEAARGRGAPFFIDEVDGRPIDESPMAEPLRDAGFARTPRGYLHRSAVVLGRTLTGQIVTGFEVEHPKMSQAASRDEVVGSTITKIESNGKHLFIHFSTPNEVVLHTHMKMSGIWHIYRPGEKWWQPEEEARVVIRTAVAVAPCFHPPIVELLTAKELGLHRVVGRLGPDIIRDEFDMDEAIRRLRENQDRDIATALLDQSVISGIGNVYKVECLFLARISPWAQVRDLSDEQLREAV